MSQNGVNEEANESMRRQKESMRRQIKYASIVSSCFYSRINFEKVSSPM